MKTFNAQKRREIKRECRSRVSARLGTCIGANFSMDLVVTQEKGGSEESYTYSIKLPYDKDGLIVNIPGLMAGLGEDAYMTEFISTAPEETVDEEVVTDEFGITMDEPSAEENAAG